MVPAVSIVYRFRIFLYKRYLQGVPAGTCRGYLQVLAGTLSTDGTCKVPAASELVSIEGTCVVPSASELFSIEGTIWVPAVSD